MGSNSSQQVRNLQQTQTAEDPLALLSEVQYWKGIHSVEESYPLQNAQ